MSIANNLNLQKLVSDFLLLLTQKERFVVERRFNLDEKERATLEEIGQHYSVTRERIRQIEKNALNKLRRNIENAPLFPISNLAYEILMNNGGVMREDHILAKLINAEQSYKSEFLQLILSVDKRFVKVPNTVKFHPYVRVNDISEEQIQSLSKNAETVLKKNVSTMNLENLYKMVVTNKGLSIASAAFKSILTVNKSIKYVADDTIGLMEWRNINPRTLRDKIFFVLRKKKEPLHFVDIANQIIEMSFDKKKINLQAVHNELIRHEEFVLIGRGIYGLSEWGFVHGTVAEIIEKLLTKHQTMSQEEIIKEVLKQRKVKPITIILSLKNKAQFVRVGRKQYSLAANA